MPEVARDRASAIMNGRHCERELLTVCRVVMFTPCSLCRAKELSKIEKRNCKQNTQRVEGNGRNSFGCTMTRTTDTSHRING